VRHGARLPFDFFLHSLAKAKGARSICIILSGTVSDGSLGLQAVHANGSLIIAQDAEEVAYDGMPRSAVATGMVDLVLPVARMLAAIANFVSQPVGISRPKSVVTVKRDDWAYPDDMFRGDCNAYVLLKRKLLIAAGWPTSSVLITVVYTADGEGHAVLTVRTGAGHWPLE
jgi:predicted transglutaminase-like cysteine proteinase